MQSSQKNEKCQSRPWARSISALALASVLVSIPAENEAYAAPPQTQTASSQSQPATQKARSVYQIEETAGAKQPRTLTLKSGGRSIITYVTQGSIALEGESKPAIKFNGPAKVSVEVYPAINRKKRKEGDPLTLSYQLDGKVFVQDEIVRISSIEADGVVSDKLAIGKPLRIEFVAGKGDHKLLLLEPVGFFRVVKIEETEEQARAPPPQTQPVEKKRAEEPRKDEGTRFIFDGKRAGFVAGKSKGDTNVIDGIATIKRLNRNVSLLLGTHLTSYGISSTYPEGAASLRSGSFDLGLGISILGKDHSLSLLPFAGARLISPSFTGSSLKMGTSYELGGLLFYNYRDRVGVLASGSNNPINPASLSAFAIVPYGWVKGYYPRFALDADWVHVYRDGKIDGETFVVPLHGNDFLIRPMLDIPLYNLIQNSERFSLVPSLVGGLELSRSGYDGTFIGGKLSMKVYRILLDAGAAVTVDKPDHRLLFFLNIRK